MAIGDNVKKLLNKYYIEIQITIMDENGDQLVYDLQKQFPELDVGHDADYENEGYMKVIIRFHNQTDVELNTIGSLIAEYEGILSYVRLALE